MESTSSTILDLQTLRCLLFAHRPALWKPCCSGQPRIQRSKNIFLNLESTLRVRSKRESPATLPIRIYPFGKCESFGRCLDTGQPASGSNHVSQEPGRGFPFRLPPSQFLRRGAADVMVTGDNKTTAKAVADKLGIEFHADVSPQKKAEVVKERQQKGSVVAMAGD